MKSLIAVFCLFLVTVQSQKTISTNQQNQDFTKIQKEFIGKRLPNMQIYFFKNENLLAAYTDGYFDCLSKNKIYSFELKTYSENEYNHSIIFQNKIIGRLFLNDDFQVESLIINDNYFKEKLSVENLEFKSGNLITKL